MIKQLTPIIIYFVGLIIFLILYPNYNTSGKDFFQIIPFLIFWLTTLSIIFSLSLSIFNFFKKRIFIGAVHLFSGISIYAVYKKLLFVDYNIFVHLAVILTLLVFFIIYRNQKTYKILVSVLLLLNIITILLSDRFILSYFNSTKIVWTESGLKWDEYKDSFENHPNENYYNSNMDKIDPTLVRAITSNSIKYKVNTKGSIPSVVIGAYFLPDESYVKNEFKTDNQLNHERGYIDICEYHVRLIRKVFSNKSTGMVDYKTLFKKYDIQFIEGILSDVDNAERFIDLMIERKEAMNQRYMFETEFGRNLEVQKKWDKKIRQLLTELNEYK